MLVVRPDHPGGAQGLAPAKLHRVQGGLEPDAQYRITLTLRVMLPRSWPDGF